jgi:hypothetical protein
MLTPTLRGSCIRNRQGGGFPLQWPVANQHQCMGGHGMKHLVKFWDSPLSPRPVAIDFLTADSFADAMEKAAAHAEVLRSEFDGRLGYSIEDEAGRTLLVRPGERLA